MINRIMHFKKHDWKHIFWLVKSIFRGFIDGDIDRMVEAWWFIRIHLEYESHLVSPKAEVTK